jgi:probable rRNA maturation factor
MFDVTAVNMGKTPEGRLRRVRAVADPVVEVQFAAARRGVPHPNTLRRWARAALRCSGPRPPASSPQPISVTLRIVGTAESRRLNRRWRGKDKATNVLSFPSGRTPAGIEEAAPLGDIVICAPVIRRETVAQSKALAAHWAHMVVHGSLHLLGFDHESGREAQVMEKLERQVLAGLGFPDPYLLKDAIPR